jgi:hypothetical protein
LLINMEDSQLNLSGQTGFLAQDSPQNHRIPNNRVRNQPQEPSS